MSNIIDLLDVKDIGDGQYKPVHISTSRRLQGDNSSYGGYAIGIGIRAAYESLPPGGKYHMYSALGNFLGPAVSGIDSICSVRSIRDTRTFVTRFVEVKQHVKGALRTIMTILCDFQVAEAPMMQYSPPTKTLYKKWSEIPKLEEWRQILVKEGKVTQAQADSHSSGLKMVHGYYDQRTCPEGIFAQNLTGLAKHVETTQDDLEITSKTTADWLKIREDSPATTPAEHAAAMAFIMDSFLAFSPLVFTHRFVDDCESAGSLDFALRFFQTGDKIDFNKWHLRELNTVAAAEGRSYSEARLWNEDGVLVCNMTQQSILRPKKGKEKL